jgi:cell division protein FtsL
VSAPVRAAAPRRAPGPRPGPKQQPAHPRPKLRVVEAPAAKRRWSGRTVLGLAGAVAIVCMLALAGFHAQLVSGQVRLDELEGQVAEEQARYAANRLEVAELESPERIVRVAQEQLGMVAPAGLTYLSPSGAMVDEVGTAGPEAAMAEPGDGASSWEDTKPYLGGTP